MTEIIITVSIIIIAVFIIHNLVRFFAGDFTVSEIEDFSSSTYNVTKVNPMTGYEFPSGKRTVLIQKIKYKSGRIKFKTLKFDH